MTITADGWVDWATRRPGPPGKVYAGVTNLGAGIVWHSMEGWLAGSLRELMNPARKASWMFSLTLDGELLQHYPISASCWASGNFEANTSFWSVELEGTQSMPINAAQQMTAEALIAEWAAWSGKAATRAIEGKTLWEHREVATLYTPNAGPTACPSERYAPLWAALEDEMTREQLLAILEELKAELDDIKRRLARIENDGPTADVPDPWLVPRLAELERKHEALNATVTPLVRDVARLAGQHANGHPSSGLAPGTTFRATVE